MFTTPVFDFVCRGTIVDVLESAMCKRNICSRVSSETEAETLPGATAASQSFGSAERLEYGQKFHIK